jgi:hypothetical protein
MCDEYDIYFTKALLAEQLQMKKARQEAQRQQRKIEAPATPQAEPDRTAVPRERMPA